MKLVGKKGMRQSGHRIFTYGEKKFNSLGRDGLLDYFTPKSSPEEIRHFFIAKRDHTMSLSEAKLIARSVDEKLSEENKEFRTDLVDTILHFANYFDIENIEAFAMTCYIYKAVGRKENLTRREIGDIMEKTAQEANSLRLENWTKFMSILKEIS